MSNRTALTERILAAALELGFDHAAVAPVKELAAADRLRAWLAEGMHGSMEWLGRDPARRADPRRVVDGARSVLVLARSYYCDAAPPEDPTQGRISRYAWGEEYHDVLGRDVRTLYGRIQELAPEATGRYYVDTGPVMEKAWAEVAGLGWIGKHTNLVRRGTGSWFFLAAILLDVELDAGQPERDHCGSCAACIDVCPTHAIVAPYVLDARRCIAYLTIENRGPIPIEFRRPIGNRVFGCDDCQEVCPWNRFARQSAAAQAFAPREKLAAPDLVELFAMGADEFRERFRGTPVKRAKYEGFRRNVAVALGNSGSSKAVGPLADALTNDAPLVRRHAAWALGELGAAAAQAALQSAIGSESDPEVRAEIRAALQSDGGTGPGAVAS